MWLFDLVLSALVGRFLFHLPVLVGYSCGPCLVGDESLFGLRFCGAAWVLGCAMWLFSDDATCNLQGLVGAGLWSFWG